MSSALFPLLWMDSGSKNPKMWLLPFFTVNLCMYLQGYKQIKLEKILQKNYKIKLILIQILTSTTVAKLICLTYTDHL